MTNPENQIFVVKSDGSSVPYDSEKLKSALLRSGASEEDCSKVLQSVEANLHNGMSTRRIYSFAYSQLKKQKSHRVAGRYRLKKAIVELGPSGYPFENFVGKLFESMGYQSKVGVLVQGKCVQHEVDVVALKEGLQVIAEVKFRSDFRGKINVQVPLYINSRFADIKAKWEEENKFPNLDLHGYVVTNGRFTADSIKYAECVGLGLISWDYPADKSLKSIIDKSGLHPLTSLHSLRKVDKKALLDKDLVLASQLMDRQDLLKEINISDKQIVRILKEAELLIKS